MSLEVPVTPDALKVALSASGIEARVDVAIESENSRVEQIELRVLSGAVTDTRRVLRAAGLVELHATRAATAARFAGYLSDSDRWIEVLLPDARPVRHRRRGLIVALLGPDGVGKSTLAAGIEASFFLPVTALYMGLWQNTRGSRVLVVLRRPLFAWWKSCLGIVHRAHGQVVVFDRYAYDARLPARNPVPWYAVPYFWLLGHSCPRPDLVILMDAPGALVYERQPEHPVAELESDRQGYTRLAKSLSHVEIVDCTRSADEVRRAVTAAIWRRYRELSDRR